ncbi:hypothetical protein B0T24DRAFT_670453 [Lasiosphaeria ovina]|uniref:Uncharacterized protein n=1 Tax=Lasiosphaeria ovina TaxID=92902 RepID=A0AAE0JVC6_9PEZI|nr:hypothetical protein B0T24DRAFT_670453 [Lasiosphaeria ovina]
MMAALLMRMWSCRDWAWKSVTAFLMLAIKGREVEVEDSLLAQANVSSGHEDDMTLPGRSGMSLSGLNAGMFTLGILKPTLIKYFANAIRKVLVTVTALELRQAKEECVELPSAVKNVEGKAIFY